MDDKSSKVDHIARFTGPFEVRSAARLEQMVKFLARASRPTPRDCVRIDLSGVTSLDQAARDSLNDAWTSLVEAGWAVRVIPPDRGEVRWTFLEAVIHGHFAWARGTPETRRERRG